MFRILSIFITIESSIMILSFIFQYASVFRDGKKRRIHKREVVVGDLVILNAGNFIPADIRITKAWNMKVDESALTQIFDTKEKTPRCSNRNPAFSQNVAFAGTSCIDGKTYK